MIAFNNNGTKEKWYAALHRQCRVSYYRHHSTSVDDQHVPQLAWLACR